jgi:PAS domain
MIGEKMANSHSDVPPLLTCWKDIAQYLGKGVRTVQRWEQEFGLPVRRPNGIDHKSPVAAHPADLDAWLQKRWSARNSTKGAPHQNGDATIVTGSIEEMIQTSLQLWHAHVGLMDETARALEKLITSCKPLSRSGSTAPALGAFFRGAIAGRHSPGNDSTQDSVNLPSPAVDTSKPLTEANHSAKDKQVAQLKQELAGTKECLRSIIEAQGATNEELQTSKEAFEYGNEELHTVNEEIQHRNELLTQLNDDLASLLNRVNLPMVMVGADLSVRRFTLLATSMLGLMANDVERPIPRLKIEIDAANLEQMMLDVIREIRAKHCQVQDQDGTWCSLRITLHRTSNNRIDGVVLTVADKSPSAAEQAPDGLTPAKKVGTRKDSAKNKTRPN